MIDKVKAFIVRAQEYAKLLAAIAGGLLIVGAQFIPEEYRLLATGILAAITAFSVYQFPNITPESDGKHEAGI